ncbi:hypothetical protein OHA25_26025 [Nonomuraea sp. NBC_00507]|uniref:hypothetical protein n=1 Tax=Nonomuraea sp. NBC_00507 TaxID=2976002 RepID=UPI002E1959C5
MANLWAGPEAVGGRLWLTSRSLVFRSHAVNAQRGVWAWPIEEIVSTAPVNTLGIVPNGLAIVLRNGDRVRFVVRKRRAWILVIEQTRGLIPSISEEIAENTKARSPHAADLAFWCLERTTGIEPA